MKVSHGLRGSRSETAASCTWSNNINDRKNVISNNDDNNNDDDNQRQLRRGDAGTIFVFPPVNSTPSSECAVEDGAKSVEGGAKELETGANDFPLEIVEILRLYDDFVQMQSWHKDTLSGTEVGVGDGVLPNVSFM